MTHFPILSFVSCTAVRAKGILIGAKGKKNKRTWISDKNDPETKGIWKGLCTCKVANAEHDRKWEGRQFWVLNPLSFKRCLTNI